MALDSEDLALRAPRLADAQPHGIAQVRLQQVGRVAMHRAGKDQRRVGIDAQAIGEGLGHIVQAGEALHHGGIGHLVLADDVVLVAEQAHVLAEAALRRDDVGDDAGARGRAIQRVAVDGTGRLHDDGAEGPARGRGRIGQVVEERDAYVLVGIVAIDTARTGRDGGVGVEADGRAVGSLRVVGQLTGVQRGALQQLVGQADLETFAHIGAQHQRAGRQRTGADGRLFIRQRIDDAVKVDIGRAVRNRLAEDHRLVGAQRRVGRADGAGIARRYGRAAGRRLLLRESARTRGRRRASRQHLEVVALAIVDTHEAPRAIDELLHDGRVVEIVARPLLDAAGAALQDEVVTLGDIYAGGVHLHAFGRKTLEPEAMAGDAQGTFLLHHAHAADHDRVAQVGAEEWREGVVIGHRREDASRVGAARGEGRGAQVDRAAAGAIGGTVGREEDDIFAEAALCPRRAGRPRTAGGVAGDARGADVGHGAAADRLAGQRVVVGRTGRLDDVRADQAVIPVGEGNVAVIEDRARVDVGVPTIAHELHAHRLAALVVLRQRLVQHNGVVHRVDGGERADLDVGTVQADAEGAADVQPAGVADGDLGGAGRGSLHQRAPDGRQRTRRAEFRRVRAHGLLEGHAADDAVGGLRVELHEVNVQVHLGVGVEGASILQRTGQHHVDAVAHVGSQHQRLGLFGAGDHGLLVLIQHEQHAVVVEGVGLDFQPFLDRRHRIEAVVGCRVRAHAVGSCGRCGLACPGRAAVLVGGKGRPSPQVRAQHRPRIARIGRVEHDLRPPIRARPGSWRVVDPGKGRFRLAQYQWLVRVAVDIVDRPVPHGRVEFVEGHALRREQASRPILDGNLCIRIGNLRGRQ